MIFSKNTIKKYFYLLDPIVALLGLIGFVGVFARRAMTISIEAMPLTRLMFHKLGYFPIRDHYYEPLTFDAEGSKYKARVAKLLFNEKKDFNFLQSISRTEEFVREYSAGVIKETGFQFNNGSFLSGDAEVLFYCVRGIKPKKIIEIGAGNSSLIINAALKLNAAEGARGEHIIIEPYENPWLERLGSMVIRERVEFADFAIFQSLVAGDIVFIDSSHVIRAQNDCVFEYTELLPHLASGVVVHIHDIFTPFDYPEDWLNQHFYLWSEQYVVEAMLMNGGHWEVLAPLYWLSQDTEQFKSICPYFETGDMPSSFWIRKR